MKRCIACELLQWLTGIACVWGVGVLVTGGFGISLGPIQLSSTDAARPFFVAVATCAVYGILIGSQSRREYRRQFDRLVTRGALPIVVAVVASAAIIGLMYGTFVAGGSDSSGYVSQAGLWLSGTLQVPVPLASLVTWTDRPEWVFAPLGHRPSTDPGFLVPIYPPGLPLVMAIFQSLAGSDAVFWVVPVMGAVGVALTYRVARLVAAPPTAGACAALMLATPVFLYQLVQPMSDVPVMTWWLAAIVAAWSARSRWGWLGVGLFVSAAVVTRPNLAPLAIAVAAVPLLRYENLRQASSAAACCALGVAPAVMLIAGLNTYWYGSPLESGYGSLHSIYSVENIVPNLRLYGGWLVDTHSPLILIGLLAPGFRLDEGTLAGQEARRFAIFGVLFTVLLALCYLPYLQFETWTYLRFFLPAFPILTVLAVVVCRRFLARLLTSRATPIFVAATCWLVVTGFDQARDRASFTLSRSEGRFLDTARWASSTLPPDTVLLAMHHTGSLNFYTELPVARYDHVGDRLDEFVRRLGGSGYGATLIIDEWELDEIRNRYVDGSALARLDWAPLSVSTGVLAYNLTEQLED